MERETKIHQLKIRCKKIAIITPWQQFMKPYYETLQNLTELNFS